MPLFHSELVFNEHPESVLEGPYLPAETIQEYIESALETFVSQINSTAHPDRYITAEDVRFVTVKELPRYA